MNYDIRTATAEMILTAAIEDYSKSSGQSIAQIRNEIIESGAYEALFDFDTGLWKEGPDYFTAFYLEMKNKKSCQ